MDKKGNPTSRERKNQIRTSIWPPDVGDLAPVAASWLAALVAVGGSLSAWTGRGAGTVRRPELRSARDGRKKKEVWGRRWRAHAMPRKGAAAAAAGEGIARAGRVCGTADGERKREQWGGGEGDKIPISLISFLKGNLHGCTGTESQEGKRVGVRLDPFYFTSKKD